jgi:hypothetical protein
MQPFTERGEQTRGDRLRDAAGAEAVGALLRRACKADREPFVNTYYYVWTLTPSEAMADAGLAGALAGLGAQVTERVDETVVRLPRRFTRFRAVDLVGDALVLLAALFVLNALAAAVRLWA